MDKTQYNHNPLRLMLLWSGLLLGLLLTKPGYCLDPPVITPLDEFFIEHNGGDVQIAPPDWQLIVDGLVEQPLTLTSDDIIEYPAQTHMATIECGGNPFAFKIADLIGNAVWTGVPVRTILEHAGLLDGAASVIFTALDGYSNRIGLEDIYQRDDIMLAYEMNEEILPPEQGYPLRLTLPGLAGAGWVQWVTHIEVTAEEVASKLPYALPPHCQIFTPTHEQTIDLDTRRIYGMALAGDMEIVAVEVSTDGGIVWQPATMLTEYVPNAWRHWEFIWTPPAPGNYMLSARAIDITGAIQGETGIYGWEMLSIEVIVDSADQPPQITAGPLLVGNYLPPSDDPYNPTELREGARLIWTYDDDRATCSDPCQQNWQYRPAGTQEWITGNAYFFLNYGIIDLPLSAMGSGLFDLRIAVTDCAGQTTYSDVYYISIDSPDEPPQITAGPLLVGNYLPPSDDPYNPTVLREGARLIWTYDDDRATCSDPCQQNWQYRPAGTQEWITGNAYFFLNYGIIDLPLSAMGSGLFDLRIAVTDCAEQTTYSETSYIVIE